MDKMDRDTINLIAEKIAEEFHPERIVLFGSHAYGTPSTYSDVDLLVVMPQNGSSLGQAAEILRRVRAPFALDILVRTTEQIEQRLSWGDRFIHEILTRGKVLYVTSDH
jgi:uncharacterized protein